VSELRRWGTYAAKRASRGTVLDFLDQHAGAFAALLTLVLIAVTAYYAFQNRRMVKEMERTRELSLLPRLALEFHRLGSATVTLSICNVGPGAALDVDVRMVYEPVQQRGAGVAEVVPPEVLLVRREGGGYGGSRRVRRVARGSRARCCRCGRRAP